MVESVYPSVLPTEGGVMQLRGQHLAGARLWVEQNTSYQTDALPQTGVSIEVLEAEEEETVLVKIGPGVGSQVWLLLENVYGRTRFSYAYKGEPKLNRSRTFFDESS
jgi:hypothetical protein